MQTLDQVLHGTGRSQQKEDFEADRQQSMQSREGTALTVYNRIGMNRRFASHLIGRAALCLTDSRKPATLRKMRRELTERVVFRSDDPYAPVVVDVAWHVQYRRGGSKETDLVLRGLFTAEVDGKTRQIYAMPLKSFGLGLVVRHEDSGNWVSNGNFQCIVIRPRTYQVKDKDGQEVTRSDRDWRLFPLGLAELGEIEIFNQLLIQQGYRREQLIGHIPNRLSDSQGFDLLELEITEQTPAKLFGKDTHVVARMFGKKLYIERGTQVPSVGSSMVMRVRELEKFAIATVVGAAGDVDTNRVAIEFEMDIGFDYQAYLGMDWKFIDPDRLEDLLRQLNRLPLYPENNPGLRHLIELEVLADDEDDLTLIAETVMQMNDKAVKMVKEDLKAKYHRLSGRLQSANLHDLREILGDLDIEVFRQIEGGSDALTELISRELDIEFSWDYPLLRKLRLELLDRAVKMSGGSRKSQKSDRAERVIVTHKVLGTKVTYDAAAMASLGSPDTVVADDSLRQNAIAAYRKLGVDLDGNEKELLRVLRFCAKKVAEATG